MYLVIQISLTNSIIRRIQKCFVLRFFRTDDGLWDTEKVIYIPKITVKDSNGIKEISGITYFVI